MAQGSLTFGANATDVVNVGTGTPFDLDPISGAFWVMPTTLTTQRAIFAVQGSTSGFRLFRLSGTTGDIMYTALRATTSTNFISSSTPLTTLNAWAFIAFTFNSAGAAGNVCHLYAGNLATKPTECTYGTSTDGVGALTALTGTTRSNIGNNLASAAVFQGRIGPAFVTNAALALADVQSLWEVMRNQVGGVVGKGLWRLGNEGTGTQQDYTGNGNAGTVTGATQSDGPPVGGWWTRRAA